MYQKQNFKDGQRLTAAQLHALEDGIIEADGRSFYRNLINAMQMDNPLIDDSEASVVRTDRNGTSVLTLLADLSSEQLAVSSDTDLILNGHTLSMSCAGDNITVAEGVSLFIDGTRDGSAVRVDANSKAAVLARAKGALSVEGGRYSITGGVGTTAAFISTSAAPKMSIHDCTVIVENSGSGQAIGVQSQADNLNVANAEFIINGYGAIPAQYENEAYFSNVNIRATADGGSCNGIKPFANSITTLNNVRISSEAAALDAYGLFIQSGATLTAKGLHISATIYAEKDAVKSALGISNKGTCTIEDSIVLADAKGVHVEESMGIGIDSKSTGTLVCKKSQIAGTHSGLQNFGNLYVSRCLLSGVCHGGLYTCHTHDKEVAVNDTVLEVGVYRGQFAEDYAELFKPTPDPVGISPLAGMYFGNSSPYNDGGDLYMDSCIFAGLGGESFCVRPAAYTTNGVLASGQNPNRLFISRSKIAVQKSWGEQGQLAPIRLNKYASAIGTAAFSLIYCGLGCNFTADNLGEAAAAVYMHSTEFFYRKNDQQLPTYEEYYSLMKEK